MLFYRAALPLSSKTLNYTAGVIRRHRVAIGSRWRSLPWAKKPSSCSPTCEKATFEHLRPLRIGRTTAWRYVNETVELLAARAPKLRKAVRDAKRAGHAYVILDGTLIPIDRVARDKPFYSGKHKRHGMNLQVIASPDGDVLGVRRTARLGPRQKGGMDRGCPRRTGIQGLVTLADKGYQGSTWAKVPYKGRNKPEPQKEANRAHAKLRALGERANAQLKAWKILAKLRCCPWRAGKLAKAIHVLQLHGA